MVEETGRELGLNVDELMQKNEIQVNRNYVQVFTENKVSNEWDDFFHEIQDTNLAFFLVNQLFVSPEVFDAKTSFEKKKLSHQMLLSLIEEEQGIHLPETYLRALAQLIQLNLPAYEAAKESVSDPLQA